MMIFADGADMSQYGAGSDPAHDGFTFDETPEGFFEAHVAANAERAVDLLYVLSRASSAGSGRRGHGSTEQGSWQGTDVALPDVRDAIARLKIPLATYGGVDVTIFTAEDQLSLTRGARSLRVLAEATAGCICFRLGASSSYGAVAEKAWRGQPWDRAPAPVLDDGDRVGGGAALAQRCAREHRHARCAALVAALANVRGCGARDGRRVWSRGATGHDDRIFRRFHDIGRARRHDSGRLSKRGATAGWIVLGGYLAVHLTQHTLVPHFHFGEETHHVTRAVGVSALIGLMLHMFDGRRRDRERLRGGRERRNTRRRRDHSSQAARGLDRFEPVPCRRFRPPRNALRRRRLLGLATVRRCVLTTI